jgi:hypothetical protein
MNVSLSASWRIRVMTFVLSMKNSLHLKNSLIRVSGVFYDAISDKKVGTYLGVLEIYLLCHMVEGKFLTEDLDGVQSLVDHLLQGGGAPLLLREGVRIKRHHVNHVQHVLTRIELGVSFAKIDLDRTVAY